MSKNNARSGKGSGVLRVLGVIAGVGVLAHCKPGGEAERASGDPYRVAATTGMIADVAREVGGGRVTVEGIIGEGVDPHLYKPTVPDVKALQAADLVFYNGLMLEGKMGDVLERVARTGKPVFAVAEEIMGQGDYQVMAADSHHDPHLWMDVGGWMRAVAVMADAYAALDPAHAGEYRERAAEYRVGLERLDAYAREAIASIPEGRQVLVTAHDAFGYMARAYGLEVRGIQGISTESEAGVRDLEALIDFLVEREIPAVFVETSVSDKNVRALVEGARARGHELKIGGELFSDAMGPPGRYEGTYIGMIDHNVTTVVRALGGQAPERGLNGRLGGAE